MAYPMVHVRHVRRIHCYNLVVIQIGYEGMNDSLSSLEDVSQSSQFFCYHYPLFGIMVIIVNKFRIIVPYNTGKLHSYFRLL